MSDQKDKEILALQKEIENLKTLAFKDELTGLYNRHGFKDSAGKFIAEIIGGKEHKEKRKSIIISNFSLVIFDLDNFKKLNDTYGHPAGDRALQFFSKIVMKNIRDIDSAARWGGEEIILGLVGATEEDAFQIADRIREKTAETGFNFKGKKIQFTVSGGLASFDKAKNFEEIFSLADKALYQAKEGGKNKIVRA
jgi:diguanylate cyclase (GGDEF)-like protein